MELLVFSTMLGSTVASGDDFLKMFVFSALLGSTLDLWCCQSTWPFHRCSSWTRFPCPDPEMHHSGGAAVAVPLHGRQHSRRCAETAPHGLTSETIEILLLQCIDKAVDVDCSVQQVPQVQSWRRRFSSHSCTSFSGADVEKTVEIPQLQLRCWTLLHTCLSFRNDRCRGWSRQCSKLWRLRSWRLSTGLVF